MLARQVVAAVLVSALMVVPAAAEARTSGNRAAVGTLGFGEATQIHGVAALEGTTVFDGDIIHVGSKGSALVTLPNGMPLGIGEKSQVQLTRAANGGVEFMVLEGAAKFRASAQKQVIARLADATVRAEGAEAIGIIAIRNQRTAFIGSERGTLLITTAHNASTVALKEGTMVEVTLAPDPQAMTPPKPATSANGLTNWQLALIAIIGSAVALGIGVALSRGENEATNSQKNNLISPFRLP